MPNNNNQIYNPTKQRNDHRHQINTNDQHRQIKKTEIKQGWNQKNNDPKSRQEKKVRRRKNQEARVMRPVNEKEIFQELNLESEKPNKKPSKKRLTEAQKRQAIVDEFNKSKNELTKNKDKKAEAEKLGEIFIVEEVKTPNPVIAAYPRLPRNKRNLHYPKKPEYLVRMKLRFQFYSILIQLMDLKITAGQFRFFLFLLLIQSTLGNEKTTARSSSDSNSPDANKRNNVASQRNGYVFEESHDSSVVRHQLPNPHAYGPYKPPPKIEDIGQCAGFVSKANFHFCLRDLENAYVNAKTLDTAASNIREAYENNDHIELINIANALPVQYRKEILDKIRPPASEFNLKESDQVEDPILERKNPFRMDLLYVTKATPRTILIDGQSFKIVVDDKNSALNDLQRNLVHAYVYGTKEEVNDLINLKVELPVLKHSSGEIFSLYGIIPENEALEKAEILAKAQPRTDLKYNPHLLGLVAAAKQGSNMGLIKFHSGKSGFSPFTALYSEVLGNTHNRADFIATHSLSSFINNASLYRCDNAYSFAYLSGKIAPLEFFHEQIKPEAGMSLVFITIVKTQGRISLEQLDFFIRRKGFDLSYVSGFNSADEKVYLAHFAAALPYPNFLIHLLSLSSKKVMDLQDFKGRTPLHYAVIAVLQSRSNSLENASKKSHATPYTTGAIKALLEAGADETIRDAQGQTPEDLIRKEGDQELLQQFETFKKLKPQHQENFLKGEFLKDFATEGGKFIARDPLLYPNPYGEDPYQPPALPTHLTECAAIYSKGESRYCVQLLKPASKTKYLKAASNLAVACLEKNRGKQEAIFSCFTAEQVKDVMRFVKKMVSAEDYQSLSQVYQEQVLSYSEDRRAHPVLQTPHRLSFFINAPGLVDTYRTSYFNFGDTRYELERSYQDPNLLDMQMDMATEYFSDSLENFVKYLELGIILPEIITDTGPISLFSIITSKFAYEKIEAVLSFNKKIGKKVSYRLPLAMATKMGSPELMALFIAYGEDPKSNLQETKIFKVTPKNLMHFSELIFEFVPDTLFAFALQSLRVEPLKFLIEKGYVDSVLQETEIAILGTQGVMTEAQLRYLMSRGFISDRLVWYDDPQPPMETVRESEITPLHIMAVMPYTDALKATLAVTNKQVNAQDSRGRTPLHAAVQAILNSRARVKNPGDPTIPIDGVEALLKFGADFTLKDKKGKRAFELIPKHEHLDLHRLFESYRQKRDKLLSTFTPQKIWTFMKKYPWAEAITVAIVTLLPELMNEMRQFYRDKFTPKDRSDELNHLTDALLDSEWTYNPHKKTYENVVKFKKANDLVKGFKKHPFHIATITSLTVDEKVILENIIKIIETIVGCDEFKVRVLGDNPILSVKINSSDELRLPKNIVDFYKLIYESSNEYRSEQEHHKKINAANVRSDRLSGIRLEADRIERDKANFDKEAESKYKLIDARIPAITIARVSDHDKILPAMSESYKKFAEMIKYYNDNSRAYFVKKYKHFNAEYEKNHKAYKDHNAKCQSSTINDEEIAILEAKFNALNSSFDKKIEAEKKIAKQLSGLSEAVAGYNHEYERIVNGNATDSYKKLAQEANLGSRGKSEKKAGGSSRNANKKTSSELSPNPNSPAPTPVYKPAAAGYAPEFLKPAPEAKRKNEDIVEDDFDKYIKEIFSLLAQPVGLLEIEEEFAEDTSNKPQV